MINMSDYAKSVFNDPKLLREKLKIYLKTPEKVEIYAAACEKFYLNGGKNGLKRAITWSWWGFFFTYGFFINRKNYAISIFYFIFLMITSVLTMICCGMYAKWHVCKRFLEILEMKDDDILMAKGGKNTAVAFISLIIGGLISSFIGSMILSGDGFNSDKFNELNTNFNSSSFNNYEIDESNTNLNSNSSASIEAPAIRLEYDFDEEKYSSAAALTYLTGGKFNNAAMGSPNLITIISKDNNTEIKNIVINRGNCPVFRYPGVNETKLKEYANKYPQNVKLIDGQEEFYLSKKDGSEVDIRFINRSDKETIEYLDSLTDEARAVFYDMLPFTINFGEKRTFSIDCDYSTVLEVTIETNGGTFEYNTDNFLY